MKEILIKDDYKILMDDAQYDIVCKYKWYLCRSKTGKSNIVAYINKKYMSFSKVAFDIKANQFILHKNGNKFDYSKENIIICKNRSEFWHLVSANKNKSSKYRGVYYNARLKKWCASVIKDSIWINGGRYETEYEAGIVADFIAIKHYDKIAYRNFSSMSFQELEKEYQIIQLKYGANRIEKIAKAGQGNRRAKYKSSMYIGVSWDKKRCKWAAQITFSRKNIHLGRFDNQEDAAKAYDDKALELYGEFAKVNFAK